MEEKKVCCCNEKSKASENCGDENVVTNECCCDEEERRASESDCCCGEEEDKTNEKGCCECRTKVRSAEEKHAIEVRINRIVGQLNGIKNMIENDRYCDDVLIQLSAVNKSVKGLANLVLDAHMHSCLIENIQAGNFEVVDEIVALFKRFQ